jgi:NADH:ubiquinone oxidoreductase subunit E
MPILQKAQEIYGYLPIEVQKMVSTVWESRWRNLRRIHLLFSVFA